MAVGYYDQEFEPWARGIRSIGSAIVQAPMLRAAAQQRQQQARLTQAQIGTEGAQAEHYNAGSRKLDSETALMVKKGQLVTALEQSAAQAQQDIADGNTNTEAVRTFAGAASALTGANGDDIIASARQGIGTILGRMGKVTEAASVENPVEIEKARIGAQRGQVIQPGGALVKDGQLVYQNPSAASQREGEYETTVQEFQATEIPAEVTTIPAVPARGKWNPFVENTEAIPAKTVTNRPAMTVPKRTVTTRRKLGDVITPPPQANQPQDPDDSEMPDEAPSAPMQSAAAPTTDANGLGSPQPATNIPQIKNRADADELLRQAQQAIADGYDPAAVQARLEAALKAAGYSLSNTNPSK